MDDAIYRLRGDVRNVAIMGGTFDPIHVGHLIAAETVRTVYGFDRIIFMPTGNPPHKYNINVTSSEHRYMMATLATVTNPYFMVSSMEIDREGYTYTVDTIRELEAMLGEGVGVYFIAGSDSILEIETWKDAPKLLTICKFIAVTRPGYDRRVLDNKIEELKKKYDSNISTIEVPGFDVSATDIRKRIASKRSIKYLVPGNVEEYIIKNKLYVTAE